MCVIAIAEDKRPSEEMIKKMFECNPAGAGIAWREEGAVKWAKGLSLAEVTKLAMERPLPYVLHFRIPSCGGATKLLCHPFPINKDADLRLEGKTKGFVLFHNGHWGAWKDNVVNAVIKGNMKLPLGKWSDSRAMAWMAGNFGMGMIELIDEKTCVFGPGAGDDQIRITGKWDVVDGIWCSNDYWKNRVSNRKFDDEDMEFMYRRGGHSPIDTGKFKWDIKTSAWVPREPKETTVLGPVEQKALPAATGGAADNLPFLTACQLYRDKKISKKAWKRAKRKHEKAMRRLDKQRQLEHEVIEA